LHFGILPSFLSLNSCTDSAKLCNLTTARELRWLILSFARPRSACSVAAF